MSFGITKQKRLSRRLTVEQPMNRSERRNKNIEVVKKTPSTFNDPHLNIDPSIINTPNLTITIYSAKSFIVMGDTLKHSDAMTRLGGKYTQLKIGLAWLFSNVKRPSVEHYIETGEICPHTYTHEERQKFEQRGTNMGAIDSIKLQQVFSDIRNAFDVNEDYEGASILDVIDQIENIHLPKPPISVKKAVPISKNNTTTSSDEMSSEDDTD